MLNHILYTKHDCTTVPLYVYEWKASYFPIRVPVIVLLLPMPKACYVSQHYQSCKYYVAIHRRNI